MLPLILLRYMVVIHILILGLEITSMKNCSLIPDNKNDAALRDISNNLDEYKNQKIVILQDIIIGNSNELSECK